MKKICPRCKQEREEQEFYTKHAWCKNCVKDAGLQSKEARYSEIELAATLGLEGRRVCAGCRVEAGTVKIGWKYWCSACASQEALRRVVKA